MRRVRRLLRLRLLRRRLRRRLLRLLRLLRWVSGLNKQEELGVVADETSETESEQCAGQQQAKRVQHKSLPVPHTACCGQRSERAMRRGFQQRD